MKKILGISLVAVLAATPLMASAEVQYATTVPADSVTVTATNDIASTSYVKGAYNAAVAVANKEYQRATGVEGTLSELTTDAKGNLVAAINEVDANADAVANSVGTLSSLETTAKGNLVAAINEVKTAAANNATEAVAGLDSTVSQAAGVDGLAVSIVQENGKLTSVTASIAANTYDAAGAATAAKNEVVGNAETDTKDSATVYGAKKYADSLAGNYATKEQGDKADTAVQTVTTGATNGTIKVDEIEVSVQGLGSAAYTDTTAYISSAAGAVKTANIDAAQVTKEKLSKEVQASLDKADGALQAAALNDYAKKTGVTQTISNSTIAGTVPVHTTWGSDTTDTVAISASITGATYAEPVAQ